jgi:hypothetical protein
MTDANAPTAKRKVTAAQRRHQALQRRIGGWTFQAIGDELGITRQAAHGLVVTALKDLNEKTMESASELQRLELERLDVMNSAIWGAVLKGDVGAIDRAIRIQARRAALMGLDAPAKIEESLKGEVIIRYESNSDQAAEDALGTTKDKG